MDDHARGCAMRNVECTCRYDDYIDNDITHARERLQAIIDWCDLAMKNANEFDSHGVRNLDGPVFDAAREYLDEVKARNNGR